MDQLKDVVKPASEELLKNSKSLVPCDICKTLIEAALVSAHYFEKQKPICDKCLEKIKWEKFISNPQNVDELLINVPTLYRNAKLKDSAFSLEGNESLFLWSNEPGTGKTHIAWAFFIQERLKQNTEYPLFSTFGALQLRLRAAMNDKSETEDKIIKDFSNRKLVILDDFGGLRNGGASDYSLAMIFEILNNRYSWKRQTIITSNKNLQEISQAFDARIASRLNAMCRVIELTGEDRRLTNV